jgi:hypothetical protein
VVDLYNEDVQDVSPNNGGGNQQAQRASWYYFLQGLTPLQLQNLIPDCVGQTNTTTQTNGGLNRLPPMQHPMMPWLYASNVNSIVGYGGGKDAVKTPSNAVYEGGRLVSSFVNYPVWRVGIDFTNRPYPIATDARIMKQTSLWPYEGNPVYANNAVFPASITVQSVNEWDRWTDLDLDPKEDAVSAQMGSMRFESSNAVVNKQEFPGQPRMVLPNQMVKLVWYEVPYRYVISTNSYFSKWLGRVNYNGLYICAKFFDKGELLYLGWRPKKYRQAGSLSEAQTELHEPPSFYNTLLCDLEFTFLYTPRKATDVLAASRNPNFVTAGHNVLPWVMDRKFHFAMVTPKKTEPEKAYPSFFSFPLEVMQYDPDAPDALQIASYP